MNKYFAYSTDGIQFFGNANMRYANLEEYLENRTNFERPDAYAKVGNSVCILEHFEFDSTKSTSKGSKSKIALNQIETAFKNVKPTEDGTVFHDHSFNTPHASKNYIANALRNLENHYCKIDSYIENLNKEGITHSSCDIEVGFFIEDTTFLGNVFHDSKRQLTVPIVLAHCKQFLDIFETYSKLDFCLCASNYGSNYFLWFINRESIQEYRKIEIDIENVEIIDFQPKSIGFKVIVQPNQIDDSHK